MLPSYLLLLMTSHYIYITIDNYITSFISLSLAYYIGHIGLFYESSALQKTKTHLTERLRRNQIRICLWIVVIQLDIRLCALNHLISRGRTCMRHPPNHQLLSYLPVILLMYFNILAFHIQIVVNYPWWTILLKDPRFRIFLLYFIFVQLEMTNGPLRITTSGHLLPTIFVFQPHQQLINPPGKVDHPPIDKYILHLLNKAKLLKHKSLLPRLQSQQKII